MLPCLKALHHLRNKFQASLEMHVVSRPLDMRMPAHLEKIKVHFPYQAWRQHRTSWVYHLHFLEHREGLHWCTLTEYVSKISHSVLDQSTPVLCCFSTDPMPKEKKIYTLMNNSQKKKEIYIVLIWSIAFKDVTWSLKYSSKHDKSRYIRGKLCYLHIQEDWVSHYDKIR